MRRPAAQTRSGARPEAAAAQEPLEHQVEPLPLFKALMQHAQRSQRVVILDCAPANSASIRVFGALNCRIEYLDLPALFPYLSKTQDPAQLRRIIESVMPPRAAGSPVSHILCWDYLNYLSPAAIDALVNVLSTYARRDALLHALIVYSTQTMPARPIRNRPESLECLGITRTAELAEAAAPNYSPKAMQRSMPGYRMEKAMLLKNGCQEYVMRREIASEEVPAAGQNP